MPSTIYLQSPRKIDLEFVRALLVIDEELLAIPMFLDARKKWHVGSFPAPQRSLSYQIQLIDDKGRSLISPLIEVENVCAGELEANLNQYEEAFDGHESLVVSSIKNGENVKKLEFAIRSILNLTRKSSGGSK